MIRRRQPLSFWALLATLAIVLMLTAPLLSRWQQAQSSAWTDAGAGALCSSRGLQASPSLPIAMMASHAGVHDDGGMSHEQACDYCLLAARLLPWVALLLVLLPWLRPRLPAASRCIRIVKAAPWRAHAARGPPLFS
ncbi:DUF2946 family protein [Xanthomonas campestris pv. campestris]|nr:DUF2946 family protein [Xanthomonas campestris pv. campestris]